MVGHPHIRERASYSLYSATTAPSETVSAVSPLSSLGKLTPDKGAECVTACGASRSVGAKRIRYGAALSGSKLGSCRWLAPERIDRIQDR